MERNPALLGTAIAIGAREHFDLDIDPRSLAVRVHALDETDFRVETNLGQLVDLDEETAHKVIERGVLGVAGLQVRLDDMEQYQAVTGFQDGQLPLMEEKLGFLARQLDPDVQEERFERVVELLDLPDVDPDPEASDVDMSRLVKSSRAMRLGSFGNGSEESTRSTTRKFATKFAGFARRSRTPCTAQAERPSGSSPLPALGLRCRPLASHSVRWTLSSQTRSFAKTDLRRSSDAFIRPCFSNAGAGPPAHG